MPNFNLRDYQTVQERIDLFWQLHPNGRIVTELVSDDGERVVMRCEVYTDRDDPRPATVDYAEEVKSSKGVNQTSRIENCATSVTGRALSLLGGVLSPKGRRPSQEEMQTAERRRQEEERPVEQSPAVAGRAEAIMQRLNAIADDQTRNTAKWMFKESFGHPSQLTNETVGEAEAFVAMYETQDATA